MKVSNIFKREGLYFNHYPIHLLWCSFVLHVCLTLLYMFRLYCSFFSCDQAALKNTSFRPPVCPSVRRTFLAMFLSSYHPEVFMSYYHWQTWCPCKRSMSKVKDTEVMTPLIRFRIVTPIWIHILQWNDAQSLTLLRRGALLLFKVIRQKSRSHGTKNRQFVPNWAFPDSNSSLTSPMDLKRCTKLDVV